jgi:hypothetical protein
MRLAEAPRRQHLEHRSRQQALVDQQRLLAVLDDQDGHAVRLEQPLGLVRNLRRVEDGNLRRERRAEPDCALHRHAAAEELGELAAEGQAEAGAAHAPLHGTLDLGELLEDALLVLGRDANAGVADAEYDRAAIRRELGADLHLAALGDLSALRRSCGICDTLLRRCVIGVSARVTS